MKLMGIDPGLAATGVGIVHGCGTRISEFAFGTIETSPRCPLPTRLDYIYSQLREILIQESPDLVVLEDIFSLQVYPKSGITLGKVSGVIMLACYRANVPLSLVTVREAKQILTGNGNADKEQLEKCVRQELNQSEPIRPFHASDALALAIIGLYRFDKLIRQQGMDTLKP